MKRRNADRIEEREVRAWHSSHHCGNPSWLPNCVQDMAKISPRSVAASHAIPPMAFLNVVQAGAALPLLNIRVVCLQSDLRVDAPMPPLSKPVSTETEKRKLALINQFKGGKSLPEELTIKPIEGAQPCMLLLCRSSLLCLSGSPTTARSSGRFHGSCYFVVTCDVDRPHPTASSHSFEEKEAANRAWPGSACCWPYGGCSSQAKERLGVDVWSDYERD